MQSLQQSGLLGHSQLAFPCILILAATSAYNLRKVCVLHCNQLCTYRAAADGAEGFVETHEVGTMLHCYSNAHRKKICLDAIRVFIQGTGYSVCSELLQEDLVLALLMDSVLG